MPISFPTGLDNLTNPLSTDPQNNPSHSAQHANANDILEAIETKVGINNSADTNSLDYLLKNSASINPGHLHNSLSALDGNPAQAVYVDALGNSGIGTTSPSGLLNLKGTLSSALTGTVAVTNLSTTVTGTGTSFTTSLIVGDSIKIGTEIFTVSAIVSATSLTLDSAYQGVTASGLTAYRDPTLFAIDNGDSVNKLTVTKSGYIGIGTNAPAMQLAQKSTSAMESPPLSSEILTSSGWTSTDWTGDFATGFTHTTGNTTPLTNTQAATYSGIYQIVATVTGRTAGTFVINFGGVTSSSYSATSTFTLKATSTGSLSITPTTDFNGKIVLSMKSVTGRYPAVYSITRSSGGSAIFEMRSYASTVSDNLFIGYNVGGYNITGIRNSVIGYYAFPDNITGNGNSGLGTRVLYKNTIGGYNSAIGYQALYNNTSGDNNTAIGYYALYLNTTGSNNFALGVNAGAYSYSGNNIIGSNSIFIGNNTAPLNDGETNQVVIGDSAFGKGSNTVTLGNDSIVSTFLKGNISVGVASPTAYLHLKAGTATASTAPLKFTSGTLLTASEAGAVEFLTDDFYATITTGAARKKFSLIPTDASFALTAAKTFTVQNTLTLSGTDGSTLAIGTGGTLGTAAYTAATAYAAATHSSAHAVGGADAVFPADPGADKFLKWNNTSNAIEWADGGGSGITRSINSVNTATNAGATASTDYVYLVSGTTTITMPTAVGNTNRYTIKNVGVNTVTIDKTGAETIDGAATASLVTQYSSIDLISDNTNWLII